MAKATGRNVIIIPLNSVSNDHGYVQHVKAYWSKMASLLYHMYLTQECHDLMDEISFAYGMGFKREYGK